MDELDHFQTRDERTDTIIHPTSSLKIPTNDTRNNQEGRVSISGQDGKHKRHPSLITELIPFNEFEVLDSDMVVQFGIIGNNGVSNSHLFNFINCNASTDDIVSNPPPVHYSSSHLFLEDLRISLRFWEITPVEEYNMILSEAYILKSNILIVQFNLNDVEGFEILKRKLIPIYFGNKVKRRSNKSSLSVKSSTELERKSDNGVDHSELGEDFIEQLQAARYNVRCQYATSMSNSSNPVTPAAVAKVVDESEEKPLDEFNNLNDIVADVYKNFNDPSEFVSNKNKFAPRRLVVLMGFNDYKDAISKKTDDVEGSTINEYNTIVSQDLIDLFKEELSLLLGAEVIFSKFTVEKSCAKNSINFLNQIKGFVDTFLELKFKACLDKQIFLNPVDNNPYAQEKIEEGLGEAGFRPDQSWWIKNMIKIVYSPLSANRSRARTASLVTSANRINMASDDTEDFLDILNPKIVKEVPFYACCNII